jgi:hypothetical protein
LDATPTGGRKAAVGGRCNGWLMCMQILHLVHPLSWSTTRVLPKNPYVQAQTHHWMQHLQAAAAASRQVDAASTRNAHGAPDAGAKAHVERKYLHAKPCATPHHRPMLLYSLPEPRVTTTYNHQTTHL